MVRGVISLRELNGERNGEGSPDDVDRGVIVVVTVVADVLLMLRGVVVIVGKLGGCG